MRLGARVVVTRLQPFAHVFDSHPLEVEFTVSTLGWVSVKGECER